jgi:two-component system, NarL family, nitrate/nitrite response regulator NarL
MAHTKGLVMTADGQVGGRNNGLNSAQNRLCRVLLADDHRLIAEAVAALLSSTGDFNVDTSETFDEAMTALNDNAGYHIVMLDLRMPGLVGLEGVRKVVDKAAGAQVVLFSAHADRHTLARAMEMGVRGLIPKTMPLQSLVSVLRLIESGQMFVPAEYADDKTAPAEKDSLSDTELYVLRLAAAGLTNKHIANDLDQSETTIKMHMRGICRKLDARNRAHAAVIGRDMGIIE